MKFIIIIYTTNKLTVVEMEDIRGVRLRKFNLRKIVLGVRVHFHHSFRTGTPTISLGISAVTFFKTIHYLLSRLSFIHSPRTVISLLIKLGSKTLVLISSRNN